MAMSKAAFNRLPRRTPTQIAEEAYQASQPRRALPTVTGPAGIPIPDPRSMFRTTVDGPVLTRIATAAYKAYVQRLTPAAEVQLVTEALVADLRKRFPPKDMAVCKRYGLTQQVARINVEMGSHGFHNLEMPEAIDLPPNGWTFRTSMDGSGAVVPADLLGFFDRIAHARAIKNGSFMDVQHWPGRFKAREHRWPTFAEISAAFPLIESWMNEQREGAR